MEFPSASVEGKAIVITGSGHGLGRYMALGLAHFGADLVVCSRNLGECEEVASLIREMGRRSIALAVDVTHLPSLERLMDAAVAEFGRIDVLINNAGTMQIVDALETSEEVYALHEQTNLRSTFFASQYAARNMVGRGKGKIINMASTAGFLVRSTGGFSTYSASKGAIMSLTKALAAEWARFGITVNAIAPGQFRTPMGSWVTESKEALEAAVRVIPMGRIGESRDIMGPALFFASDLSDYVTGQTLFVDGGRTTQ